VVPLGAVSPRLSDPEVEFLSLDKTMKITQFSEIDSPVLDRPVSMVRLSGLDDDVQTQAVSKTVDCMVLAGAKICKGSYALLTADSPLQFIRVDQVLAAGMVSGRGPNRNYDYDGALIDFVFGNETEYSLSDHVSLNTHHKLGSGPVLSPETNCVGQVCKGESIEVLDSCPGYVGRKGTVLMAFGHPKNSHKTAIVQFTGREAHDLPADCLKKVL
jgi:hypothetical protein